MATKPTETTDWATDGAALKTVPTSNQKTHGWSTSDDTVSGVPVRPNLQNQNGWQNTVHDWNQYFQLVTDGFADIPFDSALNLEEVKNIMAPFIFKHKDALARTVDMFVDTTDNFGAKKGVFDPLNNRYYFTPLFLVGGGSDRAVYDFTTNSLSIPNNFVGGTSFYESSDAGQYVPASLTGDAHPNQGPFIIWGTNNDGTSYTYSSLYDNALEQVFISGDVPTGFLEPVGYSPSNRRVYFMPFDQALTANLTTFYLDLDTGDFVSVANVNLAGYTYRNGSYDPTNDRIYLIPGIALTNPTVWHYIDCSTGLLVSYTGPNVYNGGTNNGYTGGTLDPINNRIFMSPDNQEADEWHYIDLDTGSVIAYAVTVLGSSPETFVTSGAPCFSPVTGRMYFPVGNFPAVSDFSYYIDCNVSTPVLTTFDIEQSGRSRLIVLGQMTYIPNSGMMVDARIASNNIWTVIRESNVGDSPASITSNPQYN
jgi:hypothetical protein